MLNLVWKVAVTGAVDCNLSDAYSECSDTSYMSAFDNAPLSVQYDLSNGSPIDREMFTVVHYNINSITAEGRLDRLTEVCNTLNISVLLLTESKLDSTVPSNIISIPGYHTPIRHDRPINGRHGGGCVMYISDKLMFKHQTHKQSEYYEHLWVDIMAGNRTIAVNCLYRPPNESAESHQSFCTAAEDILTQLSNYEADAKIISGDLNLGNCFCVDPVLPFKPLDNAASQLFSSFGFSQLIDSPTRVTENTVSLIDLVFVQSLELVQEYGILPQIADHDGTLLCLNVKQKYKKCSNKIVYDYKNADIDAMVKYVKEINFDTSVFKYPVSEQAEKFTDVLKQVFETFVPKKTIFIRPNSIPWCNTYTRLLLRKKNRNYKIFKVASLKYNNALNNIETNHATITQLLITH